MSESRLELPILSRRAFVRTVGTAAAAAGAGACWQPPREPILPYSEPPELVPGVPATYATASVLDGYATGLLVQAREGRPIKVEGNPGHPASLGATGPIEQASILDLYAADRLPRVAGPTGSGSWDDALRAVGADRDGDGLALLLEPTSSPLRARLLGALEERLPAARIYFHSALGPSSAMATYLRATGRALVPRYRIDRARVLVALDFDLQSSTPYHLRYARDLAEGRTTASRDDDMSRLYVAEPSPTGLSPLADHLLRVRAGDVVFLLGALVRALGGDTAGLAAAPDRLDAERARAWVAAAADDLRARPGESLVLVGPTQPPAAQALAHEANRLVGAFGRTVVLQDSALVRADEIDGGLARLTESIGAGEVDRLVVLEGDPAGTAPADVPFADALEELSSSLYLGYRSNATSERAAWTVPARHLLERWGDARAFDGTVTPIQPLIRPLNAEARSPDAVLLALAGETASVYDALRRGWREAPWSETDDLVWDVWWDDRLREGVVPRSAAAPVEPPPLDPAPLLREHTPPDDGFEVAFRADPLLHDGRFAANAWLQELPDPVTKVSWSNAALLSPRTARELGVETGDALRLEVDGKSLEAPALPLAGHVDAAVTLALGHRPGPVGRYTALGVDAYPIRPAAARWTAAADVSPGRREPWQLPIAQSEREMHERPVVLGLTLDELRAGRTDAMEEQRGEQATWYGGSPTETPAEHQWGMTIDLSRCTGCSACMVACRAENNIPVVGPDDVRDGRLMNWLRIGAYIAGPEDEPVAHHRQPMMCQQCEDAPCEYVCPTYATVHSDDGLNEMVYNRCIGTRFCSNNCPYKVRRFNWFDYTERPLPIEQLVLNPDVTVRGRGVMEKCTYCVQRIRRAEIQARNDGRDLGPDEIVTACQQACPTRAIVFGDITDPDSEVSRRREDPRGYEVLHELGTRPRTLYLARVTNPSPALERPGAEDTADAGDGRDDTADVGAGRGDA